MDIRFDNAIDILEAIAHGAGAEGADVTIDLRSREELLLAALGDLAPPQTDTPRVSGITIVHRPDDALDDETLVGALHVLSGAADDHRHSRSG